MSDPAAIRAALATNLGTISGLQASAYMLASPTPPAAHVFPEEINYDEAMARGLDTAFYTVQVFVGTVADKGTQIRLDKMLMSSGTTSVKAAIESDRTLAGAAEDLRVTKCTGYQQYEVPGRGVFLGAMWTVEVLTK